jgi:hypothetical protein
MEGEEDVILPPEALLIGCPPQDPGGGGCELVNLMDGTTDNFFDATNSFDPRACGVDPTALSYKWEILYPSTLPSGVYASNGITGYLTPRLTILDSALPELQDTDAGTDLFWRARLTITSLHPPVTQTVVYFRFQYLSSDLSLALSTDCLRSGQSQGVPCTQIMAARNGLPTTEPH